MKLQTIIMLLILTVFMMCSVAQASDCEPGEGDQKWTLYLADYMFALEGKICVFDEANGEWVGRDKNNNKMYFAGTYIIRGGDHTGSKLRTTPKNNGQRIGW